MTAPATYATEWRAFIGPPARRDDAATFWNWASVLTDGAAYAPETSIPPTVLATSLDVTGGLPEQIHLDDATGWPSAGGCWVGPGVTAGEVWAYVEYSGLNTSTGYADLERIETVGLEYSGTHTMGASAPAVRFWWPITTDDGTLNVREFVEGNLNGGNWRASLRGYNAPLPALRIGHLMLIQTRKTSIVGSAMVAGSWVNTFVGWIDSVAPADNADGEERWDVEIVSSAGVYGLIEVDGVKVGSGEITRQSQASASSNLAKAYKAYNLGEFFGAEPELGASNVVDVRTSTPWISERYIGQTNTPANPGTSTDGIAASAKVAIGQVHVTRYPGQPDGYRWIELIVLDDTSLGDIYVMYSKLAGTAPDQYVVDYYFLIDMSTYSTGDRVIVAENATLFTAENPDNDAAAVVDGSSLYYITGVAEQYKLTATGATAGNFQIRNTGSYIGGTDESTTIDYNDSPADIANAIGAITPISIRLHCYGNNLPSGPVYIVLEAPQISNLSGVITPYSGAPELAIKAGYTINATPTLTKLAEGNNVWFLVPSSGSVSEWFNVVDPVRGALCTRTDYAIANSAVRWGSDDVQPGLGDNGLWSGSTLASIDHPETLRYIYSPGAPSEPADYWESSVVHTPGYNPNGKEWVLIQLSGMGLSLAADANSGATSLSIEDAAGAATVDGLPNTGTVQIGAEQIAYTTIDRTTGVISGFTTTADHIEGDPVFLVVSSVATDGLPLTEVAIKRLSGTPEIEDMVIRLSPYQSVRTPDDSGYTSDYPTSVTITAESGTNYSTATVGDSYVGTWDISGTKPRARWMLIEITKMATQPYRAAIHEVAVTYDTGVFETGSYLSGVTVGETMTTLLDNAGFPSAGYSNIATDDVDGYTTERGELWPVLLDLADFGGKKITVGRDSKIAIINDALMAPVSADMDSELPSEDAALTKDNTRYHEFNFVNGRKVGQVELQWRSADGASEGTVKYPATKDTFGRTEVLGPHIYADATAAGYAARRRYWLLRRPHAALWEIAGDGSTHKPLRVYGGTWAWTYRTMDRTYLSVGADHEIADGAWSTVVQTVQISREDEL